MKRTDKINESIRQLSILEGKGATRAYYYIDDGLPKFDIFISDNGDKINSKGGTVRCEVDEVTTLLSMLNESLNNSFAKDVIRPSLF